MNKSLPSKNSLREHVKQIMHEYFSHLEGEPTIGIHRLVLAEVEAPLIEVVMEQVNHNKSKAAKWLGLNRITLKKLLAKYQLD